MCALGITIPAIEQLRSQRASLESFFKFKNTYVNLGCSYCNWSIMIQSWLPFLMICAPMFYGQTLFYLCGLTQHAGLKFDVKDHRINTRTVTFKSYFKLVICKTGISY